MGKPTNLFSFFAGAQKINVGVGRRIKDSRPPSTWASQMTHSAEKMSRTIANTRSRGSR